MDPTGRVVLLLEFTLAKGNLVATSDEIRIKKPMPVGEYRVFLLITKIEDHIVPLEELVVSASTKFNVLPDANYDYKTEGPAIKDGQEKKSPKYTILEIEKILKKQVGLLKMRDEVIENDANKLISRQWIKNDTCSASCASKSWSTFFPDKKSTFDF